MTYRCVSYILRFPAIDFSTFSVMCSLFDLRYISGAIMITLLCKNLNLLRRSVLAPLQAPLAANRQLYVYFKMSPSAVRLSQRYMRHFLLLLVVERPWWPNVINTGRTAGLARTAESRGFNDKGQNSLAINYFFKFLRSQ